MAWIGIEQRSKAMLGKLPADQIVAALPKGVWFSSVGTPLDDSERDECGSYLRSLGVGDVSIIGVSDWTQARSIAMAPNWSRRWWDAERVEERRLFDRAASRHSADAVLLRLTNLMEGSAELFHGPASVACTRAGIADPGLARSAAGAAAHSLHQYGIAQFAGESEEHLFAVKFRLFLAGRWPLSVDDTNFYIF